ncbi:MAG: hypothetical protein HC821_01175, partial [Lewinella sp.]|nr:hypothetical protein [Lewinella sp.]
MSIQYFYRSLLLACSLLLAFPLLARHIVGGEMTYECLGLDAAQPQNHRYRFTMIVYRDCSADGTNNQGAGFDSDPNTPSAPTTGTVTIYLGNETIPLITTIELAVPIVSQVLPDIGNPCLVVPPGICVQRGDYVFEVSLPISTQPYTIVYQRCCRNPTITNLVNPDDVGASYFVTLTPDAQRLCNNSPVFDNFPPIVLCANELFELPMGATDADGDRLVYYLCSPVEGGGNDLTPGNPGDNNTFDDVAPNPDRFPPYASVFFRAPYTAQAPLGPGANFIYQDSTGLLSGSPPFLGQFVVGICIDEFRGDTLLSTTKREFQFNVTSCARTVL